MAALAGTYFLYKVPGTGNMTRLFVYFLWFTLFIEVLGLYPAYAYITNYRRLSFIQNTGFERNYWLYNLFNILGIIVFVLFFSRQLENTKLSRLFRVLLSVFAVTALINLAVSDVFFQAYAAFTSIVGTCILLLVIISYYIEMMSSDKILNFYKRLGFYVSIGVLFWHLVVTPLFIYSRYFTMESPDFVSLHSLILLIANIFMYTCFTIGFVVCSRENNSYSSYTL